MFVYFRLTLFNKSEAHVTLNRINCYLYQCIRYEAFIFRKLNINPGFYRAIPVCIFAFRICSSSVGYVILLTRDAAVLVLYNLRLRFFQCTLCAVKEKVCLPRRAFRFESEMLSRFRWRNQLYIIIRNSLWMQRDNFNSIRVNDLSFVFIEMLFYENSWGVLT